MTTTQGGTAIDAARPQGGSGATFPVLDPATGATLTSYPLATASDVDLAVRRARAAFAEWSRSTPGERSEILHRLASALAERAAELAAVESAQTGKPIKLSSGFDVPGTIDNAAFFAGAARILDGTAAAEYSADHTSMVRREPV